MKLDKSIQNHLILIFGILLLAGCEKDNKSYAMNAATSETEQESSITDSHEIDHVQTDSQFSIGNKRYLYDISEHSIEELQSLLKRAEEITQAGTEQLEDLEIVMILHGPDIGWFTLDNYDHNRELIDLAKKLDTYDVIDLKVCETAMEKLEIDRSQIPTFIESIPYAPNEIKRLSEDGYTHL